jgi:cell division septum initiation protein DivIVA
LTYQLDAELLGSLDNLKDADFSLTSTFESRILDYVTQQIVEQLEAVQAATIQGHQAAHQQMEDAKTQWQSAADNTRRQLLDARTRWEQYEQSVRASNQPIIDNWAAEVDRLQSNINQAKSTFDAAEAEAQNKMEEAKRNKAAAMAEAQNAVRNAEQHMLDGIATAQKALDDARAALSNAFGDAQGAIQRAANEVAKLQQQIDSTQSTINEYLDAPGWHLHKKAAIAGLYTFIGALYGSKAAADGALAVASGVLHGAEYISKNGAVTVAEAAVETAKQIGRGAFAAAQGVLSETDKTTSAAVDLAENVLNVAKTGVNLIALEGAIQALELYQSLHRAAYDGAVSAIAGLMKATEYLAYTAANAALYVAENFTELLDATNVALQLADGAFNTIVTVMQDVVKFGAKAVSIESISLSGTLRGALGLGGDNSRPLSAAVKGHLLGKSFDLEVVFNPKDAVAFVKDLFER